MKYISFTTNDDFHRELKILALQNNKSFKNYILDCMKEELFRQTGKDISYELKKCE